MKYIAILLLLLSGISTSTAEVKNHLGVDADVNYQELADKGPWDDRNYQLTKKDLAFLPEDDQYLANVPIFFKVLARKKSKHQGKYYPRSILQSFQINYGGILRDGVWYKEGLGKHHHPDNQYGKNPVVGINIKTADNETPFETGVSGDESTIECNPVNKNNCVGASNTNAGVGVYYSSDAGATWTKSQVNLNSCCDPAVDWSSDGTLVYQTDMSDDGNENNGIRWARSTDQGHTWSALTNITNTGSDKEYLHVDRSATSPHKDNVYITWHDGNVMQFSRSTDKALSFSTPLSFDSEASGIGSDITSDPAGNLYYIYPSFSSGIRVIKSTNGGASFTTGTQVATLRGSFDMALPSIETRKAFIYTSTDVNPVNGDIYVAWTDETTDSTGGGNGSAATNHAWIQVAKSTDQGANWSLCSHPHDSTDTLAGTPVDRFNPWVKVGETGTVHIGYYDTRHSANRTGVDFYYASSTDGCATWTTEERYTTVTSPNLDTGQEWGDYNGLTVVLDKIAASFTDNRGGAQTTMVASKTIGGTPPGTCPGGGNPVELFAYDFESGEQGWTHGSDVGVDGWALSSNNPHAGSNAMHGQSFATVNDTYLISPAIALPSGTTPLTLEFWNEQSIESNDPDCWDGAILEISTDGGTNYQQIPNNLLTTDPYDGIIDDTTSNPLGGLSAWCGDPQAYLNSIVNIQQYAGQAVQFSFRKGNDNEAAQGGWDIDDVKIIGCSAGGADLIFKNGFE